jgi:hypothetical protein
LSTHQFHSAGVIRPLPSTPIWLKIILAFEFALSRRSHRPEALTARSNQDHKTGAFSVAELLTGEG